MQSPIPVIPAELPSATAAHCGPVAHAASAPARGDRPFRLTRHFSVTSLLGLLVVLGVLLGFYRHLSLGAIIDHETRANEALTQVFANTLWPSHHAHVTQAAGLPKAGLRDHPATKLLREDVLRQMNDISVAKVKVYDLSGLTVFSTDPAQIGENKSDNAGFIAAKGGRTASDITFRDKFDAFEGVINDRSLVYSYVPVRRNDGSPVEAVMEVYSDVTELVAHLQRTQWQIVGVVLGTLALLYLFLYAIARRADRIICAQREQMSVTHELMLRHQASHDPLTGLPNRANFLERLDLMLKAAKRTGTKVALLSLDVHGLSGVNQSLGHGTGDRLLKQVGERLQRSLREADITARRGGAEFAAAVSGVKGIEHVANVVEKIQRALCGSTYSIDGHSLAVTVNVGIAIYPDDGTDAATLMSAADAAMHHARASGRNGYQFHAPEMNERALTMLLTEQDLRQALVRNEFLLHYQPQLHLGSGRIVGMEALVRWRHPRRGIVSPAQFIPIAEERDLIVPIGEWVLREACRQNRAWQDAGIPPLPVAVNLSALQFQQRDLAKRVQAILTETRLAPSYLELELTESALMRDTDSSVAAMRTLKNVGVKLSMDDFGTGYSSLSQLKTLPLDKLKIDGSFVRGLPDDPYDLAISTAIIGMGKALNLDVIAEGVETAEQLDVLRSIECGGIQGFFLSRPLAADAYATFSMGRAARAA